MYCLFVVSAVRQNNVVNRVRIVLPHTEVYAHGNTVLLVLSGTLFRVDFVNVDDKLWQASRSLHSPYWLVLIATTASTTVT